MRQTIFEILQLDDLSSGINYQWAVVNYVLNLVAYWLKLSAMPIHPGVECPAVTSGNFYLSQINYSRIIALLKLPLEFWH